MTDTTNDKAYKIKTLLGIAKVLQDDYKYQVYKLTKEYTDRVTVLTDMIQEEIDNVSNNN